MKQPDLGKKIVELRKAKGLTQEELVETCNLSVRTLQRIEAGEVMPRSYTLKVIFSALEYPIYDSPESQTDPLGKSGRLTMLWLGQFYRYVLDLFNFKTNPMKKITILSITLAAVLLGLFALGHESKAQAAEKAKKVIEANDGNIVRWINAGKVDSVLTLYKDDACVLPDYCGKESIREMITFVISQ
jgi:transcriptional regulator with XRE-family HTH domain